MVTENPLFYNFKTMADRFPDCDAKELQQFKENAENLNTKKSTKTWVTVWTTWAEEKGYSPDIVSYEAKVLDEKLQKFFAEVRKKDGSDYEPDSLRAMIASLDRHLKEAGSSISIAKTEILSTIVKCLKGKLASSVNGLRQTSPCIKGTNHWRWRAVVVERTPWQPVS